jgi:hypothetical protein
MISNCNIKKLEKQKQYLETEIYYGENDGFFKVINIECGTGKSRTTEEIFAKDCEDNYFNYLYVVLRNDDAIKSRDRINELAGKNIAIAINTDTYTYAEFNKIKATLKDYKVIIISHEKYKVLAIDTANRKYFTDNRDTLVVDEFLDMSKGHELVLTKAYLQGLETLLQFRSLRELFAECTKEIEEYLLMDKPNQTFFNTKTNEKTINDKLNTLVKLIKANIKAEMLKESGYTKNEFIKAIKSIKQFYIQTCVVENEVIYCTDRRYEYWLLNNNIILDASAKLNMAYTLSKDFYLQKQGNVLDHKDWTFYIINTNTCKSAKERAIDFYGTINKMIEKNGIDDTAVIGNKNDETQINATYENHFMNITGSNQYKDLSNIIISHNPNLPFRQYILEYLYYSKKKFDNRNKWTGVKKGSGDNQVFRFKEQKFEEYRQCKNAIEIYQAIKRINRNMDKQSKVFILNNDTEVIDKVLKMFKGEITVKYMDNIITFEKKEREGLTKHNQEQKENSYAMKFIRLCDEIIKLKHTDMQTIKKSRKHEDIVQYGVYSKDQLREYLNIKDKSNFTNKVLVNADVIDYLTYHKIKIDTRTLDFTQCN